MKKLILLKPKILLSLPLALISIEVYFGVVVGYLFGKFGGGEKTGRAGKIKSVILNIGNYKVHLHHWFIGVTILILGVLYSFFPFPQFVIGFLGGLIYQGITNYSDWHKILMREKNRKLF